jgi:hypothetical protein
VIGIDDIVTAVSGVAGKVIDRLWPDPVQAQAAKLELLKMQQNGELAQLAADTDLAKGQLDINKIEAANPNLFIAGGRPAFIWMGVAIFGFNYLIAPLATWGTALFGHPTPMPTLNFGDIMPIVMGLLGLGAMRTTEKLSGVVGQH